METEIRTRAEYGRSGDDRSGVRATVSVFTDVFRHSRAQRGGVASSIYGEVLAKWEKTAFDTVSALWCVWVPAQVINFAVIPKHLTIPWMNAIGLMWNGVLSYMQSLRARGQTDDGERRARRERGAESQDDEQDDE